MIYLTYEEYSEMGGALDLTAFNRNADRVFGIVDNETHSRIECMAEVPRQAKAVCRELIDYLESNVPRGTSIASKSQSSGPVSESVSFAVKTSDDVYGDIQNILYDYLGNICDDKGVPLLYRGCGR